MLLSFNCAERERGDERESSGDERRERKRRGKTERGEIIEVRMERREEMRREMRGEKRRKERGEK